MKIKHALAIFGLLMASCLVKCHAVWDTTTPAGSEAKSLGDDRIREFKTDVQTALQFEGDFPGPDTSNPRFIYTPSTGTTAQRPSGSTDTVTGRLFINVSSGCIEQYNGSSWNCIATVSSQSITSIMLSTTVAGDGLVGGSGIPLAINYDSQIFRIVTDSITLATNPVINSSITINGTMTSNSSATFNGAVIFNSTVTFTNGLPKFFAYSSSSQNNQTGNGGVVLVVFGTEDYDANNVFSGSTFTAPTNGVWEFASCLDFNQQVSNSSEFLRVGLLYKPTSYNPPTATSYYYVEDNHAVGATSPSDNTMVCTGPIDISVTAGDKVTIYGYAAGGVADNVVDIVGTSAGLKQTWFMGRQLP